MYYAENTLTGAAFRMIYNFFNNLWITDFLNF